MVIVTSLSEMLRQLKKALSLEAETFKESQKLRMKSIRYAKQVGDIHIAIKERLADASPNNPVTIEEGTFTSWQDFLDQQNFKRNTVTRYIDLANGWDIVLKLGMQDESNAEALQKSMRLCRTVKIIKWYRNKLAAGCPEDILTLDLYWQENEPDNTGPTKKQLSEQVEALQEQVSMLDSQIAQLTKALDDTKTEKQRLSLENLKLRSASLTKSVESVPDAP